MKLTTGGIPDKHRRKPVVGKVLWEVVGEADRSKAMFLRSEVPRDPRDLRGYRGFLTTAKLELHAVSVPAISSVQELVHLRTGDIVAMEPAIGFVRTLYRPDSDHNVIFATQRCNSNCLMCSQPPRDRDDTEALLQSNLERFMHIYTPPTRLASTYHEPSLF